MMKILAIDTYPLILPVAEIYGGAAGTLEECRSLIVRVEAENGIDGWGEATQGRPGNTYETLETMEIMVRQYFGPALIGMDLEETGSVLQRLHEIRSGHPLTKAALETAVFDALANCTACLSIVSWAVLIGGRSISWAGWGWILDRKASGNAPVSLGAMAFMPLKSRSAAKIEGGMWHGSAR